jgi:hypothetical protein
MKKIIVSLVAVLLSGYSFIAVAQNDPVGQVFDKYAGKDGFTTVNITGDLLKMAAKCDAEDKDLSFLANLTEIRVLAQECEPGQSAGVNFQDEIWPKLDKSAYKELLIIKEKDQDVKMLARENGKTIQEFLIIVSGSDENVLVQIKGNLNMDEIDKLSDSFDFKGFEQLKKLEDNPD